MPGEARSSVVLDAKTRGFPQATSAIERLGKGGAAAMRAAKEEVDRLEGRLRKLVTRQTELNRELEKTSKGSRAFKQLAKELRGVEEASNRAQRNIQSLGSAFRESAKKGAFFQGLMQGGTGVDFFQRGQPGQMRQAMGVGVGRSVRGVAGGLASTPFSGAAGLAQALQSVPGGGAVAAPLMVSMQRAQQALQFRQQRQELSPFLQMGQGVGGGSMSGESAAQQRKRIEAKVAGQAAALKPKPWQPGEERPFNNPGTGPIGSGPSIWEALSKSFGGGVKGHLARSQKNRDIAAAGGDEAYQKQQQEKQVNEMIAKEGTSRRRYRARSLQDVIRKQGQRFGMALPDAMQFAGGITQAGGGTGAELESQGLLPTAMAAKRGLGIGADVSGAFLQGGRRGGVVGGKGRAGGAMMSAIKDGMALGLEGSELTQWMSQMAGDIRNWRTTGIPLNTSAVTGISRSFSAMGLGGLRGGAAGRAMGQAAQQLGGRGPQSAAELVAFQEFGGFNGGGAEGVLAAQKRLESGEGLTPDAMQRVVKRFSGAGGGGAAGVLTLRRALKSMNVNVSAAEAEKMASGQMSDDEQGALLAERKRGAEAAGGFSVGAVAKGTDGALKRQAGLVNQQIATGQSMIVTMQNLESTTGTLVQGFSKLASGPLKDLTGAINQLSGKIVGNVVDTLKAGAEGGALISGGGGT